LAGAAITAPKLSFTVSAPGKLTLSWSEPGFMLQENSGVQNPTGWTNVANGATSPVTVDIATTGEKFYRLFK
jgi:hypothetical protein